MKALGLILLVTLVATANPVVAEADGRRGDGRVHPSRGFRGRDQHRHHGHHPHRLFPHRSFFSGFASPAVILSSPVVVTPAPVYLPPPPALSSTPPPAYVPPLPRVVEFPTGRYELRGDGVTSPYMWVWIPNPPAAPSPPLAPAAPPAAAVPDAGDFRRTPERPAVIYRWTSEDGVTTWTDSLEKVPAQFRAGASRSAITR